MTRLARTPHPARAVDEALDLHRRGELVAAEAAYRAALARSPQSTGAWMGLGLLALNKGAGSEAVDCLEQARKLSPRDPAVLNNLGLAYASVGREEEALAAWRRVLTLEPRFPDALVNLANADARSGRIDNAIQRYRAALAVDPGCTSAAANLGGILVGRRSYGEAVRWLRQAAASKQATADVLVNLGRAYSACGLGREAREALQAALRLRPGDPAAQSNLLMALHYCDDIGADDIAAAHFAAGRAIERDGPPPRPAVAPGRPARFRVGLLSADFNDHAVMRFLQPYLETHDRAREEVLCYHAGRREDAATERARACASAFLSVADLDDDRLHERLLADGLDVLVDLSGHSAGGRPRTLARRPAPLQVSWLGYLDTTGLRSVDYRITDAFADPPGLTERLHSEKLWRMQAMWCYQPRAESPPTARPPAQRNDWITFGSTNNPAKISDTALSLWADVLARVSRSRLLVHAHDDPLCRDRIANKLAARGIGPERISFAGRTEAADYLRRHEDFDILLDTTPYSGGTTACDALWMGVPVVTLAGNRPFSRTSASVLQAAGFPQWIAESAPEFVQAAAALAADVPGLVRLRGQLRDVLRASRLCDERAMTAEFSSSLRAMWNAAGLPPREDA